jgi:hypothetical protein
MQSDAIATEERERSSAQRWHVTQALFHGRLQ